jgi:tetratricopeptide (TPR) repeat protein
MRALGGLAQHLWQAGRREESLNHFWQALRLNSNDNQGLRYILMSFLLESGRDADAEKLFRKFPDDAMAAWAYSRALLDFRKHGDSSQAAKSLKAAVKQNKHVPPYLLGRKRLLSKFPDYYGFGDDNEALLYVKENGAVWRYTLGALAWLEAGI